MEGAWDTLQEQYLSFAPAVSDVLELARACSAEDGLRERLDDLVDCASAMVARRSGVAQAADAYGRKRARYWGFRRSPARPTSEELRQQRCQECGQPISDMPRGEVIFHSKGMRGPLLFCGACFTHQAPEVSPWALAGEEQPAWAVRETVQRARLSLERDPSRLAEVLCSHAGQPCVLCPACGEAVPLPEREGDVRCGHCLDLLRRLPARNHPAVRRLLSDPLLRDLLSL
jgi:DNA-directed RNA polymerase subunit RPC12/RpoP